MVNLLSFQQIQLVVTITIFIKLYTVHSKVDLYSIPKLIRGGTVA